MPFTAAVEFANAGDPKHVRFDSTCRPQRATLAHWARHAKHASVQLVTDGLARLAAVGRRPLLMAPLWSARANRVTFEGCLSGSIPSLPVLKPPSVPPAMPSQQVRKVSVALSRRPTVPQQAPLQHALLDCSASTQLRSQQTLPRSMVSRPYRAH